jgi:malate dehydrogenase
MRQIKIKTPELYPSKQLKPRQIFINQLLIKISALEYPGAVNGQLTSESIQSMEYCSRIPRSHFDWIPCHCWPLNQLRLPLPGLLFIYYKISFCLRPYLITFVPQLIFILFKYNLMKVTVVGAGAVGATCADNIARKELCDELVILDIKEGVAEGKAMDLMQTATLLGFDTRITGSTNDYSKTAGTDVAVITSGIPRKPGMTREELIGINAGIVRSVTENLLKYSPNAIIVVISNPMDTMTYLALKSSGLPKNRIIGMGGILDSSRFKYYLSTAMGCPASDLQAVVIGGHGDTTMIPLARLATYQGTPVSSYLDADSLKKVVADTMVGGATLTGLLGTSAWYAPGAAGAALVEAIVRDEKKLFPCCVYLEGEYGQQDICIGVPVVIGRNGIEKIIDYKLNEEEQAAFNKSADAVRSMNGALANL